MQYAFILGNTPQLSVLEIKSVLSDFIVTKESEEVLIVEIKKEINIKELINILGGTIKIAVLTPSSPPNPLSTDVEKGKNNNSLFSKLLEKRDGVMRIDYSRYCNASATCSVLTLELAPRSAIVRDNFKMRK